MLAYEDKEGNCGLRTKESAVNEEDMARKENSIVETYRVHISCE